MNNLLVERESHFLPPFTIKYSGKYISLFGRDNVFLKHIYLDAKNANPSILNWGTKKIFIIY